MLEYNDVRKKSDNGIHYTIQIAHLGKRTWESALGNHTAARGLRYQLGGSRAGEFFALPLVKWHREDDDRFSFYLDDLTTTQ